MAAAGEALVANKQEGWFFFQIRDAVPEIGTGIGLLAWLRSRELVRVWEAVWTCIGGGEGRALEVVWDSVSISESELPSNPQDACGTFASAPHWPI